MLLHNTNEPFPKLPRLVGYLVQFPCQRLFPNCLASFSRHESHLAQPVQETLTAVDPIDDRIRRLGDRVQKIQTGRKRAGRRYAHEEGVPGAVLCW